LAPRLVLEGAGERREVALPETLANIQGNAIFMAGFMYDAAGNPVWYVAQGALDASGTFNGAWQQMANGQTMTGAYRAPVLLDSNVGSLSLAFGGSRAATLTLPGGRRIPLTRFDF